MTSGGRSSTEIEIVVRITEKDGSTVESRFAEEVVSPETIQNAQVGELVHELGVTVARHFGHTP